MDLVQAECLMHLDELGNGTGALTAKFTNDLRRRRHSSRNRHAPSPSRGEPYRPNSFAVGIATTSISEFDPGLMSPRLAFEMW